MIILGLHLGHDGSACVVRGGKLVAALSSERLSRQRKSHGVTQELIAYVLAAAGIRARQIDAVALSDYHSDYAHGVIKVRKDGEIVLDTWNRVWDNEILEFDVALPGLDVGHALRGYNVGHHLSHCAAAFYTSPFDEAYCVSMDASGGELKSNFVIAHGKGKRLTALETPACCVGIAYGFFTEWLGLGSQMFKAGSLMALASYGSVLPHVAGEMERHVRESFFQDGHGGHYRSWMASLWDCIAQGPHFAPSDSDGKRAQDIGASIQAIFDNAILECVNRHVPDGSENLCLGGGSFLNCNVNSKVLRESKFKNVHLFPACSDDGCAVGAALYVAHAVFGEKRREYLDSGICYLGADGMNGNHGNHGPDSSQRRLGMTAAAGAAGVTAAEFDYGRVARAIADGKIVAWVNGRSEYGPRALGNRSMLADPRTTQSRERINNEIKMREWFRPVCPSVLEEDSGDWFDHPTKSPFMLFTARALRPEVIPGAVHVDGSARMQTVARGQNPHFYSLISAFKEVTGVPCLINTSLNEPGRPIIESREEALDYWERYPVDMLVLDGEIHER